MGGSYAMRQVRVPGLKPRLFEAVFHGLKAVASTVASLREAVGWRGKLPEVSGNVPQGLKPNSNFCRDLRHG